MSIVPTAVLPEDEEIIRALRELEGAGAISATHLGLTNPDMSYDRWESLGRFFGRIGRAHLWWVGDWLIFGDDVFGHAAAQGVEATTKERYSEAERVTGFDHGTLLNVRSICARVARPRRRKELGFWIHSEVAALEADDQTMWLQAAIDNGWTRDKLRAAVRGKNVDDPEPADLEEPVDRGPTPAEQIKTASTLVVRAASVTSDGDWLVPAASMAQLAAALGEEMGR